MNCWIKGGGAIEPIVKVQEVVYKYTDYEEREITALDGVTLDVEKGEFLVIIGHNGSGKSTLAKHINAINIPEKEHFGLKA